MNTFFTIRHKAAAMVFAFIGLSMIAAPAQAQSWGIYIDDGYSYGREEWLDSQSHWRGRHNSYQPYVSRRELEFHCRLGSQTPISMRRQCAQEGYWSHDNGYYGHDSYYEAPYEAPRKYRRSWRHDATRDLAYQCSLGDQTPISMRKDCIRYGYWGR